MAGVGRPEEGDDLRANQAGQVRGPRVVADEGGAAGHRSSQVGQVGLDPEHLPGKAGRATTPSFQFHRAQDPDDLPTSRGQQDRQGGESLDRPALGGRPGPGVDENRPARAGDAQAGQAVGPRVDMRLRDRPGGLVVDAGQAQQGRPEVQQMPAPLGRRANGQEVRPTRLARPSELLLG